MKDDRQFPEPREPIGGFAWPERELPHENDLAFFRSGSPDPIEAACRLGRFFGCSPVEFLAAEPAIVTAIIEQVILLIEEERDDYGR